MGSTLFGTPPSATTRPVTSATQTAQLPGLLDTINNLLTGQQPTAAAAGTTAQSLLGGIPAAAQYQAPTIDATQAFQTGVVQPTTTDFLQRTLPSVAGQFGGSAGGAFGSGSATARDQAAVDTTRALAEAGTKYSLAANLANQQASLQSQQLRNELYKLAPQLATVPAAITDPFIQDLLKAVLQPTQETVGIGGQTGLVQGLLGGAGGAALGTAGGNLLTRLLPAATAA